MVYVLDKPCAQVILRSNVVYRREYRSPPQWELWHDVRSIKVKTMDVIIVFTDGSEDCLKLNLESEAGKQRFIEILALNAVFVVHDLKKELHAIWSLGLTFNDRKVFDIWVAASCLYLGNQQRIHTYTDGDFEDDPVKIVKEQNQALESWLDKISLEGLTKNAPPNGAPHPPKNKFKRENSGDGVFEFGRANPESDSSSNEAKRIQNLYSLIMKQVLADGLYEYLMSVEIPYTVANAWVEWHGIGFDESLRRRLEQCCRQVVHGSKAKLKEYGVIDLNNKDQFINFLERENLMEHFTERTKMGQVALNKKVLKGATKHHPAISAYYQYTSRRRVLKLWGRRHHVGSDGRLHPEFIQNTTVTGRSSIINPAIGNLEDRFKSLVVGAPDSLILEFDYDSFELAVAAVYFGQLDLLDLYHTEKDLYQEISTRYFSGHFNRKQMKLILLAYINGVTAKGICSLMSSSQEESKLMLDRLESKFPDLARGICAYVDQAIEQGYAPITMGLKRLIVDPTWGISQTVLRRSLQNTPIQGTAAAIFKLAVAKIYERYRETGARIVLQMHDSVVMEVPEPIVGDVQRDVPKLMTEAGRYFFPNLHLKVTSSSNPHQHWGQLAAIDEFISN